MKSHLAFWLPALLIAAPASAELRYLVDETFAPDGTLGVSLELPSSGPRPARLVARPLPTSQPNQIGEVHCDGRPLEKDGGGWLLPRECRTASWTVSLVRTAGVQASDQRSIWLDTGWGIMTEPSAILRPESWEGRASLHFSRAPAPNSEAVLPSLRSAPGIFLIGSPPTIKTHGDGQTLNYVGDDLEAVLEQVEPAAHLAGLAYLRKMLGTAHLREAPVLTVIWLGVERAEGSVGGAAGNDAVLVNYIRDAISDSGETLMPLAIVIHEQFHQLVKGKLPLWAAESLAQFYGLKTLTRIDVDQAAVAALWERSFAAGSDGPGLAEVQEQVQQGDTSNYDMFYGKGVAFWNRVDLTIQSESGGARSLDDIMPTLLGAEFNPEGSIPDAVLAELPLSAQGKIRAIEREFL